MTQTNNFLEYFKYIEGSDCVEEIPEPLQEQTLLAFRTINNFLSKANKERINDDFIVIRRVEFKDNELKFFIDYHTQVGTTYFIGGVIAFLNQLIKDRYET